VIRRRVTDDGTRWLTGPIAPVRPSRWQRMASWMRRHPAEVLVCVVAALAGAVTGAEVSVPLSVAGAVVMPLVALLGAAAVRWGLALTLWTYDVVVRVADRLLAPTLRTLAGATGAVAAIALAVFVAGGLFGLLVWGWRAF
jgi:hypothetical protein